MSPQYILDSPLHYSPSYPLHPWIKVVYFYTWLQNTSTIFAFLHPLCLSSPDWYPPSTGPVLQDPFYLSVLHFLSVYWLFRGFHLGISGICLYHALIRLTSIIYSSCPVLLLLNSLQCIELYYLIYKWRVSIYFWLSNIHFPSPASHSSFRQTHQYKFSMTIKKLFAMWE
jgi:hypothetical protein